MKNKILTLLNKIPYKKISLCLLYSIIIGSLLWLFNHEFGQLILLISFTVATIIYLLFTLKMLLEDWEKILFVLFVVIWLIAIITMSGNLMIKYIPSYFPANTIDKMYDLYSGTFASLLSAVIAVGGTYFGAVYGGKKSIQAVEKQIAKQEQDIIKKEKENKKITIRIITKFLKEEIISNNNAINDVRFYEFYSRGFGKQYGHNLLNRLNFNDYEKIKYELVKYTDVQLVEDVIDLYELFYILVRHTDIKELNEKEYNKLANLETKLKGLINLIDS